MFGNSPLLVSHYIIDLVENDFFTQEQRQFEKQLKDANEKHAEAMINAQEQVKNSRWAFFGSIAAFLLALIFGLIQSCNDTKMDKEQFNQIIQTIKQKTIPDVINTKIINDTLITKTFEMPQSQSKNE